MPHNPTLLFIEKKMFSIPASHMGRRAGVAGIGIRHPYC